MRQGIRIRFILFAVLILLAAGTSVGALSLLVKKRNASAAANLYYLAENLATQGELDQAKMEFLALVGQYPSSQYCPDGLEWLAKIGEQQEDLEFAGDHWDRLAAEFPADSRSGPAAYRAALAMERRSLTEEAQRRYTEIVETFSGQEVAVMAGVGLVRLSLDADGSLLEARTRLYDLYYKAPEGSEARELALSELGDLNVRIIFSKVQSSESLLHKIVTGDSVTSLGVKYNTTKALIAKANNLRDPSIVALGKTLKITPGLKDKEFRVRIELDKFRLSLFRGDEIFKIYRVGVGKVDTPTPAGRFKIKNKEVNPKWWSRTGKVYGPLEEGNQLGTRWMGLEPLGENLPSDLGIHGTIQPETVGKRTSNGCVRLYKEEVEELFDLLPLGTIVETS